MSVPAEITTTRLFLRSWRATDAATLLPLLEGNQAHLAPWIPRHVSEVVPLPALEARLAGCADAFRAGTAWRYAYFLRDEGTLLGEVSLFPRSAAGRVSLTDADRCEVGYWLRSDALGRGLATEAARAMVDVARTMPQGALVEIRCDPRNAASGAVARRLGCVLEAETDDTQVWVLRA